MLDTINTTGLKNLITDEYMTRAQALTYHRMCKNAALDGGFYFDAINYHQHILNDMLILEDAARR